MNISQEEKDKINLIVGNCYNDDEYSNMTWGSQDDIAFLGEMIDKLIEKPNTTKISDNILDKEITSFLMDNAESMQKVLIQEIRDKFIEKVDDKIVWKQGFRVRMQKIKEATDTSYNKGINDLLYKIESHYFDKSLYFQQVKVLSEELFALHENTGVKK